MIKLSADEEICWQGASSLQESNYDMRAVIS